MVGNRKGTEESTRRDEWFIEIMVVKVVGCVWSLGYIDVMEARREEGVEYGVHQGKQWIMYNTRSFGF